MWVSAVSAEQASQRTSRLTSSDVYPACVILPNALVAPMFFSSSAFSSADIGARRSSSATEKGMSGSPGLFASIQALIRGNLSLVQHTPHMMAINADLPFVFLADIILLGKVDKICNRFGCEQRKSVYNINLCVMVTLVSRSIENSKGRLECSERKISQRLVGALLPPR